MGQLKTDGRAAQFTIPAGDLNNEELFRVDGWNFISMESVVAADTARVIAGEISSERIWYVKTPAGVGVARGAKLYWANPAIFQKGDTHLQAAVATAGDPPACKVEEVQDANGYTAVRVLNT